MKIAIVLAVAVACALAAPPTDDKNAQVVSFNSDIRPDGSFDTAYETSNGIASRDNGQVKQGHDEKNNVLEFIARSGEFSWKDNEGQVHSIKWIADENGYQAEGADVPRAA